MTEEKRGGCLVKRHFVLFLVAVTALLCAGCSSPGRGDWLYDLPNGFRVFMCNSRCIAITHPRAVNERTQYHETYIESFIRSFCYNERYVGAVRVVPEISCSVTDEELRSGEREYYILDTETQVVYGPFDEAGYAEKCAGLSITGLCDWILTRPRPEGAYIAALRKEEDPAAD